MKKQLSHIIFASKNVSMTSTRKLVEHFEVKTYKIGSILKSGPITENN